MVVVTQVLLRMMGAMLISIGITGISLAQGDVLPAPTATPGGPVTCPLPDYGVQFTLSPAGDYGSYSGTGGVRKLLYPKGVTIIGEDVYSYPAETVLEVDYYVEQFGEYVFSLRSPTPEGDVPIRYFLIINEQFWPLGEDGETLYHDLIAEPRKWNKFSFALPPLAEGIHDIVFFGIPNYAELSEIGDFLQAYSMLVSSRFTLVVGEDEPVLRDAMPLTGPDRAGSGLPDNAVRPPLNVTLDATWNRWNHRQSSILLPPGGPVTFFIKLGQAYYFTHYTSGLERSEWVRANPDNTQIALLMLQDEQPVPIVGDQPVFYGDLPASLEFAELAITREAPLEGRRDLVIVRIDNPGQPRCHFIDELNIGVYVEHVIIEADAE